VILAHVPCGGDEGGLASSALRDRPRALAGGADAGGAAARACAAGGPV